MSRLNINHRTLAPLIVVLTLSAALAVAAGEKEGEVDENLTKLTERATADLAEKLEIAAADVEVVSSRRVTWRDSSCGCPKEGEMYAQMLTEGALILLRTGDEEYRYHSSMSGPPFHCENPAPNDPLPDESS